MKKIEAIIRPEKLDEVKEAIFQETSVKGLTVSQVLGCGQQLGWKEYVRGQEVFTTLLPKVQLSLVVTAELVDTVTDIIVTHSQTGEVGDGKIFVYDVADVIRIRTGEKGEKAL